MKKIYSFILTICASLLAFNANSQCEISDTLTTDFIDLSPSDTGIYCENTTMEQVLQVVGIKELEINNIPLEVTSLEITDIENIPNSLDYECPNNCIFTPQSDGYIRGCIKISGIPTQVFDDSIKINIHIQATIPAIGNLFQTVDTSAKAQMTVIDANDSRCVTTGLESFDIESELSIFPNPANQSNTTVNLNMPESAIVDIALYDVLGNKTGNVFNGQLTAGNNSFNLENLDTDQGMYLIKIEVQTANGVNSYTERIIIE